MLGKKDGKKDEYDDSLIGRETGDGSGDPGAQKQQQKLGGDPKIPKHTYEMRVKNQVIYMHPEKESIRLVRSAVIL